MNCETFTRVSTSSLYKNGRLIAQTSALFLIRRCQNIKLDINTQIFCCGRNRMLRIFFMVRNTGSTTINNAILVTRILPACSCLPCGSNMCREFMINNLLPNNSNIYYLDVVFPCNTHYIIKGSIMQDNVLLKEECITV